MGIPTDPRVVLDLDRLTLDWSSSGIGFCLTEGVLYDKEYWQKWRITAQITGATLIKLLEWLAPWRMRNAYSYQFFQVVDTHGNRKLDDLTCGQGALAVIDYLNQSLKVQLVGADGAGDIPITTMRLVVNDFELVFDDSHNDKFFQFFVRAQKSGTSFYQRLYHTF